MTPNNTSSISSSTSSPSPSVSVSVSTWPKLPTWCADENKRLQEWGERLPLNEWDGTEKESVEDYRANNGWKGSDLVHSKTSPVRILEYRVQYSYPPTTSSSTATTILTGMVHFTPTAESHKGYCHGGSMCSIMDDIIGWTGFNATTTTTTTTTTTNDENNENENTTPCCKPWSGYTVQVNTKLMKPVPVGSVLKLEGWVDRIERRKVYIKARLSDVVVVVSSNQDNNDGDGGEEEDGKETKSDTGVVEKGEEEVVYAEAEGLVILNRGVIPGL